MANSNWAGSAIGPMAPVSSWAKPPSGGGDEGGYSTLAQSQARHAVWRQRMAQAWNRLEMLRDLYERYSGGMDYITQWMIGKELAEAKGEYTEARSHTGSKRVSDMSSSWARAFYHKNRDYMPSSQLFAEEPGRYWQEDERRVGVPVPKESVGVPVPKWIEEFLEPNIPLEGDISRAQDPMNLPRRWPGKRGGYTAEDLGAYTVRPLGAQAELSLDELGQLASYLKWVKAGAPTKFGKKSMSQMANAAKYWQEYQRQSQAMMPKDVGWIPARWRPREQT